MNSLRLYTGNRLDLLAKALADVLKITPPDPLVQEIIVVQSRGMERWISMQLASRLGVCANCRFPFPNAFAYEIFQCVFPELPDSSVFDPRYATWKIMEILISHLEEPGFAGLKQYLGDDRWSLKQLQLCRLIAETFDQYILYRPDLISRWEAGDEDHWQAVVWRNLVKEPGQVHRAALGKIVMERIRSAVPGSLPLPRRVSVFGISYLPPFHLQILDSLSELTDVNLFLLNPCREYWGDIASGKDFKRIVSSLRGPEASPEDLFIEKGNPLLASMGALGRDFFELLASFDYHEATFYSDPGDGRLLACIQSDILNLKDRTEQFQEKTDVPEADRSVQIHSCHSPMRELEVLYDHLLEMFERDPSLLPKDILVMTPAIEAYASFIQAVFDAPEDERKRIPYSISDRSLRKESRIVDTFLAVLDLRDERLTASQVLGILESPPVQARFGLRDADLDLIGRWVRDVCIRWGIDEQARLPRSSSAFRENTWRAGLDRLLLGYAMPGRDQDLFAGILPYDNIEGSETSVLGAFIEFVESLFQALASLDSPKTLDQWSDELLNVFANLFEPSEDSRREVHTLRQAVVDLDKIREVSGFAETVDIRVIKWHLAKCLEWDGPGLGFMRGGVTFCSMLPMRSIPFRVICLLGMDGDAYPRQTRAPEFDLMARYPRLGDRSARNDDRYLFLEAVISAQETLYISYTGQSCRDNSTIPPSVLVSELLDYIGRAFRLPHGTGADSLVTRHRLQPFSPAYFTGDQRLFTYSAVREIEARAISEQKPPPPLFIATALSPPEEVFKNIDISQLCRFFRNPARFLLDKRFGMSMEERVLSFEETEPLVLSGLEKYSLEQSLLEHRMAGLPLPELFPSLKASGRLPHGTPGECAFEAISRRVEDFAARMEPYLLSDELEPLEIDLPLSGFSITGRISLIYPERMVRYRYAGIRAKDRLNLWIQHLVLNALRRPEYPAKSIIAGLNSGNWCALEYAPVENSREILEVLLRVYWNGLSRPLHFFPETSFHYARLLFDKDKSPEDALRQAESTWSGNDPYRGECEDPCFELCFRSDNPLDEEFQRLAAQIFQPLLAHSGEPTHYE